MVTLPRNYFEDPSKSRRRENSDQSFTEQPQHRNFVHIRLSLHVDTADALNKLGTNLRIHHQEIRQIFDLESSLFGRNSEPMLMAGLYYRMVIDISAIQLSSLWVVWNCTFSLV